MNTITCELPGLVLIESKVFGDQRGFFLELWSRKKFEEAGILSDFQQDNISFSRKGILRGLHYQNPNSQGKLVTVLEGEVYDVAVDLRRSSATFGRWFGLNLSGENKRQFYIPPGFAHGFQVLSKTALFHYKCSTPYSPQDEMTLKWDDPALSIPWPLREPLLSDKDKKGLLLKDIPANRLFD